VADITGEVGLVLHQRVDRQPDESGPLANPARAKANNSRSPSQTPLVQSRIVLRRSACRIGGSVPPMRFRTE
jgi:hypothetical protein